MRIWKKIIKSLPSSIINYTKHITGVDDSNKFISDYELDSRTLKWWIFFDLIDLAIVNAWIIFRLLMKSNITQLNFRIEMIEEIIGKISL